VWEKIKKEMTKNARCGSAGYQAELNRAASVFVAILPHLSDQKTEEDLFNADREVTEALVNRKHPIDIGVLKG
jgi:hypothetical protein